jgi:hypothetical protein
MSSQSDVDTELAKLKSAAHPELAAPAAGQPMQAGTETGPAEAAKPEEAGS